MDPRNHSAPAAARPAMPNQGGPRKKGEWMGNRYMFVILTILIALLLLGLIAYLVTSAKPLTSESKYIKSNEYQAVFLNNGQVYFGKIDTLNTRVVVIKDVFYIESQSGNSQQQTAANNNYTLRKLGSTELHAPEDSMIVNRDQVTFWENIKDSGKVVTAIKKYKQNPNDTSQVQQSGNETTGQSGKGYCDYRRMRQCNGCL